MCDQRHNIIKHTGDEDEEDLEFLRLAALKSLQNKKEPTSSTQYINERISNNYKTHNKSTIGLNSLYTSNRIEQPYIIPQHQISPNNYNTRNENFFVNNSQRPLYRSPIDGNNTIPTVKQNNLENFGTIVEKLNMNEPYVPHCLPASGGHSTIHSAGNTSWSTESTTLGNTNHIRHGYHPTMSYVTPLTAKTVGIHDSVSGRPNVQLSPRSLAFVEQNNDILARRKGGNLSPNNYNRSPRRSKTPDYRRVVESSIYKAHSPNYSPTSSPPYRPSSPIYSSDFYKSSSPRRWSLSPHNYKKAISRSPPSQSKQIIRQRSPGFNRKRTVSRSPQRYSSRSPPSSSGLAKPRTRSRSPTITININAKHRSPPILLSSVRRYSRSPLPVNERHVRKTSRSPKGNNSRHCSPYASRYSVNKNRSPIIHHNKKRSPNSGVSHSESINEPRPIRIRSPIQPSSNNSHVQHQNKNYNKRTSSSPFNQQQQIQRNRSRTPPQFSPLRKYTRRSRDRNIGGHITEQEKNRNKRSPINKKRRGGDTNGAYRNRGNNVRHNLRRSQSPSAGLSNFNNYNNRKRRSRSRNTDKSKRLDDKDNYDRKRIDRNGIEYKRENNLSKYEKDIDEKQYRNINKNDNNSNDKIAKIDNKLMNRDDNNENLNLEITETNDVASADVTSLTPPLRINDENLNILEKTNQRKNIKEKCNNDYEVGNDNGDNKTNISENNDDDEEEDEDGIDLFPSDDSESETEGRFKSNSNQNERKTNVTTLSFAKLNASSVPDVIKDLQDVCNNKNSKGHDNRFDRRRDDRSKKNYNSRSSRNDKRRYNDIRNRKNSRSQSSDRKKRDEISGKYDRRDIDSDDKRKNVEKSMFKSTFQAIDNNEGNKINSKNNSKSEKGSLGKFNSENNKKRFKDSGDSLENNNYLQQQLKSHSLKRSLKTTTPPIINFDKCKSAKVDTTENKFIKVRSLTPIPTTSCNKDGTDVTTNGKKSIHSRLGAMTNTFKSAKKSSSWTKTSSSLTPPLPSSFTDKKAKKVKS